MGLSPDMVTFCMGMAKEILEGDSDLADGLRALLIPLYFVNRAVEEKKAVAEKRTVKKPLLKLVARDRGNVGRPEAGQKAQIKKSERGSYAKP